MMTNYALVLVIAALTASEVAASEAMKHPIRDEIVEEIKLKATSWTPKEVSANHFSQRSAESIKASMGHLGTAPTSLGAEMFKKVSKGAMSVFKQMTSAFGTSAATDKDQAFHLKQEQMSDSDLPHEFSWREKMPECLGPIED